MSYALLDFWEFPAPVQVEVQRVISAALVEELNEFLKPWDGEASLSEYNVNDGALADFVVFGFPDPEGLGDAHPAIVALEAAGYEGIVGGTDRGRYSGDIWPRQEYPEATAIERRATERIRRAQRKAGSTQQNGAFR